MHTFYRLLFCGAILAVAGGHWLLVLCAAALYKGRTNPTIAYDIFNHFAPIGFIMAGLGAILSTFAMVLISIANAGSY